MVTLQPVQGTPGGALTVRTDNYGAFAFSSLAAGAYTVRVSKVGFLPTEYGQKRWNAAGTPIALTADGAAVLIIRLPRYGAITGTVVDENDVGLVQHRVAAYRDSQPPVLVTSAISDDRGVYRLSGLDPGTYLVRTGGVQNEGVDYLPTFAKETLRVEEAYMVAVAVDEESASVNVRPAPGKLFTLSRVTVTAPGELPSATPEGPYELYAEMPGDPRRNVQPQAAFTQLMLERETTWRLPLLPIRETLFDFTPPLTNPKAAQVWAQRVDVAGKSPPVVLLLTNSRAMLFPGRWELRLAPPPGFPGSVSLYVMNGVFKFRKIKADLVIPSGLESDWVTVAP